VPFAPTHPVEVQLAPARPLADLPTMADRDRTVFARLLVDVLGRLDRLFGRPLPYMMWLNQRPTTGLADDPIHPCWFNVEIVSPWRAAGVARYIAAAEIASEEYFNPVVPEQLAADLRRVVDDGDRTHGGGSCCP
jgi:UDPglucose--hexose-1-phosphate uridylyltransferase